MTLKVEIMSKMSIITEVKIINGLMRLYYLTIVNLDS